MQIHTIEQALEIFEAVMNSKEGLELVLPTQTAHTLRARLYLLRKRYLEAEAKIAQIPYDYLRHPYKEIIIKLEDLKDGTSKLRFIRVDNSIFSLIDIASQQPVRVESRSSISEDDNMDVLD